MKFKQLAIASALLMASSAASALYIQVENISITPNDLSDDLQWSTYSENDFGFNLNLGSNVIMSYGRFTTWSFPFLDNDMDGLNVSFDLNPPGANAANSGIAYTFSAIVAGGADDKLTINFDNTWIDMGAYNFRFKDTELNSDDTVDLEAEFQLIPEPSVLALFGAGLLGLGAVRRRKNKS
jgi:hypothetical protein